MSKRTLGIFLALFATYAMADVYSWTDDQGITHYGENVPSQYAKKARNLSGKKDVDKLTAEKRTNEDFAEKQRQERQNTQNRQAAKEEIEKKTNELAIEILARQKAKALTGEQ